VKSLKSVKLVKTMKPMKPAKPVKPEKPAGLPLPVIARVRGLPRYAIFAWHEIIRDTNEEPEYPNLNGCRYGGNNGMRPRVIQRLQ
jgi:hypothetical protein